LLATQCLGHSASISLREALIPLPKSVSISRRPSLMRSCYRFLGHAEWICKPFHRGRLHSNTWLITKHETIRSSDKHGCSSQNLLTIWMPHFTEKLHFGRIVWVVHRELQLRLKEASLHNKIGRVKSIRWSIETSLLTSYNVSAGPSKTTFHRKRS